MLIGINEYLDPAIPRLQYCVSDARLMARCLTEKCGYASERILLMTDDQTELRLQPLRQNIRAQLESWFKKAGGGDTLLVFFSCHGFLIEGKGYLAPQNCQHDRLEESALSTRELADLLQACAARKKVLILDCCHAGTTRNVERVGPSSEELGMAFRLSKGMLTLASCSKDQRSHEWHARQQGLFTYFMAEGLSGAADYDHNGLIDSDEIYRYTMEKVPQAAQRELNGVQTPVRIIEDAVGVFPLAWITPSMPGERITNSLGMELQWIPAGRFTMGSPDGEDARDEDEGPQHGVRIIRPFYLGVHEVTQEQYRRVMGSNPSHFSTTGPCMQAVAGVNTGRFPVEGVSWEEAQRFCRELSRTADEARAQRRYRLPAEAEWEYACRAGTTAAFSCGDSLQSTRANFNGGLPYGFVDRGLCLERPAVVGSYRPNPWGLFDMHGNVWEWCEDWHAADYYDRSPPEDPRGPDSGSLAVVRGGAWNETGAACRSAERFGFPITAAAANVGFRVLCDTVR